MLMSYYFDFSISRCESISFALFQFLRSIRIQLKVSPNKVSQTFAKSRRTRSLQCSEQFEKHSYQKTMYIIKRVGYCSRIWCRDLALCCRIVLIKLCYTLLSMFDIDVRNKYQSCVPQETGHYFNDMSAKTHFTKIFV